MPTSTFQSTASVANDGNVDKLLTVYTRHDNVTTLDVFNDPTTGERRGWWVVDGGNPDIAIPANAVYDAARFRCTPEATGSLSPGPATIVLINQDFTSFTGAQAEYDAITNGTSIGTIDVAGSGDEVSFDLSNLSTLQTLINAGLFTIGLKGSFPSTKGYSMFFEDPWVYLEVDWHLPTSGAVHQGFDAFF